MMLQYYKVIESIVTTSKKKDESSFKSFLELGVGDGNCVSQKMLNFWQRNVAVDVNEKTLPSPVEFFHGTTDDFFAQNKETFDVIFIDACHAYDYVKRDLFNAIPLLNEGGIIFMHDTDPVNETLLGPSWCGDGCRINPDLQKLEEWDHITLPIDIAGLTILRRKNDIRCKNLI